ncbi:MAG: hypothetical protein FWC57_03010 [Endomicrobia bacterium]|nr:hypothetical protein [Endomicrobiia bacterium]
MKEYEKMRQEMLKILEESERLGRTQEQIQILLDDLQHEYNNASVEDFDGLSPYQMSSLLQNNLTGGSIVTLNSGSGDEMPLIKQIKYFLNLLNAQQKIKLTATGALPVQIVKDIYSQGFIKDEIVELGLRKIAKERDIDTVILTRVLCELLNLTKKRKNILTLADSAFEIINSGELFKKIFKAFAYEFNWAYFDRYWDEKFAQSCFEYSLYLFGKYGGEFRKTSFYAQKYTEAFFKDKLDKMFPRQCAEDLPDYTYDCYQRRFFEKFLEYFGFVEYESKDIFKEFVVKKSPLFDKYISIKY